MRIITTFAFLCISLHLSAQNAQQQKINTLRRQLTECSENKKQLEYENTNLHDYQKQLLFTVSSVRDSLNNTLKSRNDLADKLSSEITKTNNLTLDLNKTKENLSNTSFALEKANYEISLLQDPQIARVYELDIESLKKALNERLSQASLGFQFDEDVIKNQFKITKAFDGNAEAWWVFDKTIDVLLEMNLKLEPHKYEPNKTLVLITTNLLEKVRYSNKQYTLQEDKDKIKLYQEKAMRVLEENIRRRTNK